MAIHVSPGAYTTERDLSLYVPQLSSSIFGVVGTASRGPMNKKTFIASEGQLIEKFGAPDLKTISADVKTSNHQALLAAIQYLKAGNQLWYVRVGTYEAYATANLRNATDTQNSVVVRSLYPGSGYNDISVIVTNGTRSGTYKLTVKDGSFIVEVHDNLVIGTGNASDADYIETRINQGAGSTGIGKSVYIYVTATTETTLQLATTDLTGGDDGEDADIGDVVGTVSGSTRTGLQIFDDPESVDVNLLAAPGRYEASVIAELLSIGETRGDCLALPDLPLGLTSVQDAIDFHNGDLAGVDYPAAALNSSYGFAGWPWVQFFDGYNNDKVWVPPSGILARICAYTDSVAFPWYAPAGFQRARIVDALDLEYSPRQGERDLMYSGGNALNPFVNFSTRGIALWGQRTLQRSATATDRVNVRRLLLYARKVIATATLDLVFEPNDSITWIQFTDLVNPYLREIANNRGLYDFRVVCDDTTNTPTLIDQNTMLGKLFLKPTKAAEQLEIEFTVLPTGASFEEYGG